MVQMEDQVPILFRIFFSSQPNNLLFRLASHEEKTGFGVRLLRAHIALDEGEHQLIVSTQTYQSPDGRLLAENDMDVEDDIPESNAYALKRWHYVYMGYDS